jgi:hypothetical protein
MFEYETSASHRQKGCLTKSMLSGLNEGVTNYYLPVFGSTYGHEGRDSDSVSGNVSDSRSNGKADIPSLLLWFMDSRGGYWSEEENPDHAGESRPDWVDESVCFSRHFRFSFFSFL